MALRLAAILTLAVGLGPALAMFTIVQAALIRPLPYPEPERVVTPFTIDAKTGEQLPPAAGVVADRVAAMTSFDRVARMSVAGGLVLGGSDPDNVFGSGVEAPFFQIFGMPIVLGRQAQQPNEAVISSRLWEQRFGRRDDVIGKVIRYRDQPVTVVGVASPSYDFPYRNEIWYVMAHSPDAAEQPYVDLALRLAPGVTVAQARAELATVRSTIASEDPRALDGRSLLLKTFHEAETEPLRFPLLTLLGAAALVVIIACANVANLLLAAGERRQHEMAVRRALGASQGQLVWQLMREAGLLAGAGVVLGLMLATFTVPAILAYAPDVITRRTDFAPSWEVAAFAAALTVLVTIGFGMAPALRLSRVPAMTSLRASSPSLTRRGSWLMQASLAIQSGVGVVLVVATALMLVSLTRLVGGLSTVPADQLTAIRINVGQTTAAAPAIANALLERLIEPSAGRVVASAGLPMHPVLPVPVSWAGQASGPPRGVPVRSITPGFFTTVGQRMVRGRDFSTTDRPGADVAIVSETLAKTMTAGSGRDALESSIDITLPGGRRTFAIVGVAADVRAAVGARPGPEVYVPLAQVSHTARGSWIYVFGPAAQASVLAADVKRIVREFSAETAIADPARLDRLFGDRLLLPRFRSALVSAIGAIAMLLAASGVFAVVVCAVARRTRELAIRMALGATSRDVTSTIVPGIATPVVLGLIAGLVLATRLSPFVRSMLFYDVSATSPAIYAGAAAVFLGAATLATWLPLRRAWRLNPADTLRRD